MDIHPEDETSQIAQYQEAFLKYVENEYCTNDRRVLVEKHKSLPRSNSILSERVFGSCQSSFDPDDLSSDDEQYLMPYDVAETTPG